MCDVKLKVKNEHDKQRLMDANDYLVATAGFQVL